MRVGNSIGSLIAQRQLSSISKVIARSLERLSSGKRINSAKDGVADLAIGTRLEAQHRGMLQAIKNINDAAGYSRSLADVISAQTSIVQKMRELSLRSSNGTLTSAERSALNNEFQELYSEFNRLSTQSEFNGQKIADGSFGTKLIQAGTKKGETISLSLPSLLAKDIFVENRGSGEFSSSYFEGWNGANIFFGDTGDVNGDGLNDLAGGIAASNYIQLALGDGSFSAPITAFTITGSAMIWTGIKDINDDGKGDLFATTSSGYIVTALGNGNGTFGTPTTWASASGNLREIQASDINGDGKVDLVGGDFAAAATVSIFLGNGDGTFATRTTLNMPGTSYGIELTDINNDGTTDIISGNQGTGIVFLNQGNSGTFTNVALPFNATSIDIADLNNDGNKDILFSLSTSNYFGIAFGNGDGTFATPTTYNTQTSRVIDSVFADLNGDGYLDVTWSSNVNGEIGYAFNNGSGVFSAAVTKDGNSSNNMLATDTNNDGAIDLIATGGTRWRTYLGIPQLTSALDKMSITTAASANDVLDVLDNALDRLSSANASVSAIFSRLEFAAAHSMRVGEDLSTARSTLMDVDIALETAELVKNQILQDINTSILAQANLNRKLVLELLKPK